MRDQTITVKIALFAPIPLHLLNEITTAFLAYDPNGRVLDSNHPETTRIDAALCLASVNQTNTPDQAQNQQ